MVPDFDAIKKASTVTKRLCERMNSEFDFKDSILNFVSCWIECASGSIALIGGNTKLRDDPNIQNLLSRDQNHTLIRAVKSSRTKVLKTTKEMKQISESESVEDLDASNPVASLLRLEVPEAVVSELSSEAFDDVIASQCAEWQVKLNDIVQKSVALCDGCQLEGHKCWKGGLSDNASYEELRDKAQSTLYQLAGKTLRLNTEEFMQAGQMDLPMPWY